MYVYKRNKTAGKTLAFVRGAWSTGVAVALLTALLSTGDVSAQSANSDLEVSCTVDNDAVPRTVSCDLRHLQALPPDEIRITANGETLAGGVFEPFSAQDGKSAWLYLIDTSNPRRAATVESNVDFVQSQLSRISEDRLIGVATFASEMSTILPITDLHTDIEARLGQIEADGVATEFFSNALRAVQMLADVDADRKALVIMSDGKAEDTAFSLNDVTQAANEAGIKIIGLGFAESATETPALQPLERLALETGGTFAETVAGTPLPSQFSSNLVRYLENGGTITVPMAGYSGDVAVGVEVSLSGGGTVSALQTVAVAEELAAEDPSGESDTFAGSVYRMLDAILPGAAQWANANSALAIALLLLPVLLIAAALWYFIAGRKRPDDEFADEFLETESTTVFGDLEDGSETLTRAVSTGGFGTYGFLEVIGNEEERFAIDSHSISIGRHSDNDFRLGNDAVHRHHAHLNVSSGGVVTIHDLSTVNGVVVNGQRVDKANLANGDMIELGEVRIRYSAA